MISEQPKEKSKSNPLLSNQHQFLLGTLAQSQGFCRIIVRCMINQLHQTGANDHQCHM